MVYGKRLKLSIFIMGLLIGLSAKALEAQTRMDFRFGVGTSLLGTGDARTIMLENELNYKLNKYFVLGGGLAYARNYSGIFDHTSFIQLNTNIYASPFRNT